MVKAVWLSKADACALLTAKNLYRHLRGSLPAERAAEDLFKELALEKFQATVHQRCFVEGNETHHILVPVDRDVYLVLKAMGLCGEKDSKGRRICVANRWNEWREYREPVVHKTYVEALKILTTQFRTLSGESEILNEAKTIYETASELFGDKINNAVWDVVKNLDKYFDTKGHATDIASKYISQLSTRLKQWMRNRLETGTGKLERHIRKEGRCSEVVGMRETEACQKHLETNSYSIAKYLMQSVLDVCFHMQFNRFWEAGGKDRENVEKYLISMKGQIPGLIVAYTHERSPLFIEQLEELILNKTDSEVTDLRLSLGLPLKDVQAVRNDDRYIKPLIAVQDTSESDVVSYLLQVLYQQYVVLFLDLKLDLKGTYTLAQLEDSKARQQVKTQFLRLFGEDQLAPLRELVNKINTSTGKGSVDATPFYESIRNRVSIDSERVKGINLDSYRRSQSTTVKEKTTAFLAQGLSGSVLLCLLNLNAKSAPLLRIDDLTSNLPLLWRYDLSDPSAGVKLAYTLKEAVEGYFLKTDSKPLICGLCNGIKWVSGKSMQTKISEVFRDASGLGKGGKNRKPVFATEVIFEEFRKVEAKGDYCTRFKIPPPKDVFSTAYLETLRYFYRDHKTYDNDIFTPSFMSSFKRIELHKALENVVTELNKYTHRYDSLHGKGSLALTLSLKLQETAGDHYISLSPTKDTHGFFVTAPFLRWMMCTQYVPKKTAAVVGWWRTNQANAPILEESLRTCEIA